MDELKIIAVYLPQFHRLPENDEWWGEGYTEWTAVKAAEKLFDGHNQTREPLNDNYYNLLDKETMIWQVKLAKKYGIYGFCFYHYYFKNGKKILEKPIENLLRWKEIDINYCFSWANGAWARTWSGLSNATVWSDKFENEKGRDSGVLLEQEYGNEKEWKEHFKYLLPFFLDTRYIKVDNKPVFIFHLPEDIHVLDLMLKCWEQLAVDAGLAGIYSIVTNSYEQYKGVSAVLLHGPSAYQNAQVVGIPVKAETINQVESLDYEEVWKNAVYCRGLDEHKTYFGGFVDYDDTPRRGRKGWFLNGTTPEIFERYAYQLAVKNLINGNEFFFINAWNEWGEGNYLEPDKKNGYAYLEALKRINTKCHALGFSAIEEWKNIIKDEQFYYYSQKREKRLQDSVEKYQRCYQLLNMWLLLREKNIGLEEFFIKNNYKKVAIYGFAAIGKHLYEELRSTSVEIVCAIDRRQGLSHSQLVVISSERDMPDCDVIVVTVVQGAEQIVDDLRLCVDRPVITLWEVMTKMESALHN